METTNWAHRKFNVTASVSFHTAIGTELDTAVLMKELLDADECHPWKMNYSGGEPARSMEWHSSVRLVESPYEQVRNWTDRSYVIEFRPALQLRGSQIMAYHSYVSNLADLLAKRDLAKVESVSGSVSLAPFGESYRTPTAMDRYAKALEAR